MRAVRAVTANGRRVWLWCWLGWLGVLVAGCSSQGSVGSTLSPTATLTLLGLTQQPASPTPPLRLLRTPILRATGILGVTLAPAPPPLTLPPPDCYETPAGSLWCLGLARNDLTVPVEEIIVRVYLVSAEGAPLAQREAPVARISLLPGEAAPYGVLFEAAPEGLAGPVVILVNAVEVRSPGARAVALEARDVRSEAQGSLLRLSGNLVNNGPAALTELNLVVTLFDARGRVTGFRHLRWPAGQALPPGQSLPFALDAAPQGAGSVRYEVKAEGRPG